MKKILFMLVTVLLLVGCNKETKINTEYDSLQLEVVGTISAGCPSDEDTYLSHHYKDKHIYKFDYKNNLEYYASDIWVIYNTKDSHYLSMDRGTTFKKLEESEFERNYRALFEELLDYINESDKTIIDDDKDSTTYEILLIGKETRIFEIVKKFGITNNDQIINDIKVLVTVDSKGNITQIKFELKTKVSQEIDIQNCYNVYWNLSNYNEINIELPKE